MIRVYVELLDGTKIEEFATARDIAKGSVVTQWGERKIVDIAAPLKFGPEYEGDNVPYWC